MKYLRTYSLTIDFPNGDSLTIGYPLTIDINVNTNILASCNTAVINIYNLSEDTRRLIFHDWTQSDVYVGVTLKAGYEQGQSATIFRGNIRTAYSVRNGVDWVTTIDAWDSGFAVINGYTSRTVPAGYTMQQSITEISKDMPHATIGSISAFDGKKLTDERGASYEGPSWDVIRSINAEGLSFIEAEKIYCIGFDEYLADIRTVQIDAEAGLLGTPQRAETLVKVKMLFEPKVTIGRLAELNCAEPVYNGTYRIDGIAHAGTFSGAVCGSLMTELSLFFRGSEEVGGVLPAGLPGLGA